MAIWLILLATTALPLWQGSSVLARSRDSMHHTPGLDRNKHHKKLHGTTCTLYEIFFIPINGDAEWELCCIHCGHCWNLHCWFFLTFATQLQLRHIHIMRRVCIYLIIPIQIYVHSCTHIITYPDCPILRCCCKDELELLEAFVIDLSKGA